MVPTLTIFVSHIDPDGAATIATLESISRQVVSQRPTVFVLDNGTVDRGSSGSMVRAACNKLGRDFMYQRCRKEPTRAALYLAATPMVFSQTLMFMEQGSAMAHEHVLEAMQATLASPEGGNSPRTVSGCIGRFRDGAKSVGYQEARDDSFGQAPVLIRTYNYNLCGGLVSRYADAEMYHLRMRLTAAARFVVCDGAEFVMPEWSEERQESYDAMAYRIRQDNPPVSGYVEPQVIGPVAPYAPDDEEDTVEAEPDAAPEEWVPSLDEPDNVPVAPHNGLRRTHSGRYSNAIQAESQ